MMALGLIETKGLIAAIEGADAMLKAANVRLLEKTLVGSGLVTVTIAGEVGAVSASISAAVGAIGKLPGSALLSHHVIPRPDSGVATITTLLPLDATQKAIPTPTKKTATEKAAPEKAAPVSQPVAKIDPVVEKQKEVIEAATSKKSEAKKAKQASKKISKKK